MAKGAQDARDHTDCALGGASLVQYVKALSLHYLVHQMVCYISLPICYAAHLCSLRPNPLAVRDGGLAALSRRLASLPSLPSAASRSKKSCQSSANDSLLLELLAMSMGSVAELSDGVEGVRRKGEMGMRKPLELDDVPGRARPACSLCSVAE